jgi:hypothetical protein
MNMNKFGIFICLNTQLWKLCSEFGINTDNNSLIYLNDIACLEIWENN